MHCFLQESEIVRTWLCELHMEDCWELFVDAGYDMPTISRMTPEVCFLLAVLQSHLTDRCCYRNGCTD